MSLLRRSGKAFLMERAFDVGPEVVWEYLTDPQKQSKWMGASTLDPRLGGAASLKVTEADSNIQPLVLRGTVSRIVAHRSIEVTISEPTSERGTLRIEVAGRGSKSRVRVIQDRKSAGYPEVATAIFAEGLWALQNQLSSASGTPLAPLAGAGSVSPADGGVSESSPFRSSRGGSGSRLLSLHGRTTSVVVVCLLVATGVVGGITAYHFMAPRPIMRNGCSPDSHSQVGSEPDGWSGVMGASCVPWTNASVPVVFYWGSTACPYCDASSWVLGGALEAFGLNVSSTYAKSNVADVYPATPGLNLSGGGTSNAYLDWVPLVGTLQNSTSTPNMSRTEQNYTAIFDGSGSIPFVVVGGLYVHLGTFLDPQSLFVNGSPLSPQEVMSDTNLTHSPTFVDSVAWVEAYFAKGDLVAGIAPPAGVTSNSTVAVDLASIS